MAGSGRCGSCRHWLDISDFGGPGEGVCYRTVAMARFRDAGAEACAGFLRDWAAEAARPDRAGRDGPARRTERDEGKGVGR